MIETYSTELLYIIILAYIIAFILAFGVGANDVANSFGTSVGSKVLTLRQACILATIFESLGSILLGLKVSSTVRTGVFDVKIYEDQEKLLILCYLSALIGSSIWNLVATFFKLPVSGTHGIIGAVLGSTLAIKWIEGIKYSTLATIVSSWFISPILSGLCSLSIYFLIDKYILHKDNSFKNVLKCLPIFYGITICINVFSIINNGPEFFYLDKLQWYISFIIALFLGIVTALIIRFFLVPYYNRQIRQAVIKQGIGLRPFESNEITNDKQLAVKQNGELNKISSPNTLSITINDETANLNDKIKNNNLHLKNGNSTTIEHTENKNCILLNHEKDLQDNSKKQDTSTEILFKYLQILTACFGSFAHGGNDVSNAIGPLIGIILIWSSGNVFQTNPTPFYLMAYGGLGISIGLLVWGRRVIKTIGEDLTKITPSTGFSIEIGAAFTVLVSSKIGLPISTTHCKVGSVVFVGKYKGEGLDWKLFGNIVLAWILTVPITAICSATSMLLLKYFLI